MKSQFFARELNASFNLRKPKSKKPTNVYMVCRLEGKQVKLSTGVKVYPEHWDEKKQEAYISFKLSELDNRNNHITNNRIKEVKEFFSEYVYYLCNNPDKLKDSLSILKSFIYKKEVMKKEQKSLNASIQMMQLIENGDGTESTKNKYRSRINNFIKFLKEKDIPDQWNSINLDTLNAFQQYLIDKEKAHNTIASYFATITTILNDANKRKDIPFDMEKSECKYFKLIKNKANKTNERKKQITLTDEQVKQFYEYVPTGKNAERDIIIRDMFVLQCLTGQRIGDMDKVLYGNIANGYITIKQQKRGENATIPLPPFTQEILNKYKNGTTFDYSDQKHILYVNNKLKEIAEKLGWNEMIEYEEFKGDKVKIECKPFYKLIHSHTARHTFITLMLRRGVQPNDLKYITGHSDTKKIDEIYSHLNEVDIQNRLTTALSSTGYLSKENEEHIKVTKRILEDTNEITTTETTFPNGKKVTETTNYLHGYTIVETVNEDITETVFTDNIKKEIKITNNKTGITQIENINTYTGITERKIVDSNTDTIEETIIDNNTGLTEIVTINNQSRERTITSIDSQTGRILNKKIDNDVS